MLSDRRLRRMLLSIVAVVLLGYVGYRYYNFRADSIWWANMGIDERHADVLYGVGMPNQVRPAGGPWRNSDGKPDMSAAAWAFTNVGGGRVEVEFDPADGKSREVSCSQPDAIPGACPTLYGIGLGTDEDTLLWRLGRPTSASLTGESKFIEYADIGARFALKQYTVYRITTKRERDGWFGRLPRFVRTLVP